MATAAWCALCVFSLHPTQKKQQCSDRDITHIPQLKRLFATVRVPLQMSQLVEYSAIAGGAANVNSLTLTANQVRGHTQIAVRNIVVRSMAMRLMQREWHVRAFCVADQVPEGQAGGRQGGGRKLVRRCPDHPIIGLRGSPRKRQSSLRTRTHAATSWQTRPKSSRRGTRLTQQSCRSLWLPTLP